MGRKLTNMPRAKNEYVIQIFDDEERYKEAKLNDWKDTHWTNVYLAEILNQKDAHVHNGSPIIPTTKAIAKKALAYIPVEFRQAHSYIIVKIPVDK